MGNYCGCEFSDINTEILHFEFEKAPKESTLFGMALNEEPWVRSNQSLHSFNLSTKRIIHKSTNSSRSRNLESFHISLNRSIQSYSKTEDDPNSILFEGELLKYRPGMSSEYIPRWCRLTNEGFAYYKNQWSATCSNKTPLAYIPLLQIREVSIVNRPGKKIQNLAEFEIFLMQEEELLKLSRDTEGFTIRKNDSQGKVSGNWWSVRQVEWYTAEKRLLFATANRKNAKKWVSMLEMASKDISNSEFNV